VMWVRCACIEWVWVYVWTDTTIVPRWEASKKIDTQQLGGEAEHDAQEGAAAHGGHGTGS